MPGIGDLVAHLGLDNSGFKKGLSSSRSLLSSFAGGIAGLISPIGAMFAGIAGGAGIGLLVKSSFEGVDALAKFGQKLGLTAEQAAGFQHAAELSGVGTDQLSAAMQRLSRQGLDIFEVADNIAAIQDPAERSAYAFKVLGKSGADLIPMLMGGSAALKEMVDEGSKLSGLKGLDASQIEEANDAISRASAAIQGLGNMLAITLAPGVEFIAKEIQSLGLVAQFVFENMGSYAELAWTRLKLGALVAAEEFKHLFTVQIPQVITFMVENVGRLLVDGFGHAVEKLADNMANAFEAIWDYIASGGTQALEFTWEPIGKGFADVMADLPPVADREMSELEKQLRQQADAMGANLGEGLADRMFGGIADPNAGGPVGAAVPAAAAKQAKSNKAAFQGSQAAAEILLRGKGGGSDAIPAKQLGVQQQILAATKANKPATLTPLTLGT